MAGSATCRGGGELQVGEKGKGDQKLYSFGIQVQVQLVDVMGVGEVKPACGLRFAACGERRAA
jgi:hypothetical protein